MSELKFQRGLAVPKWKAIAAMLSKPGTAIQGDDWGPGEWCVAVDGEVLERREYFEVRDQDGYEYFLTLEYLQELWWIMEPVPGVEQLEAERAELAEKLEALNAKIAAAKEAQS